MILHLVDNASPSPQHVVDSARHFGYSAITLIKARTGFALSANIRDRRQMSAKPEAVELLDDLRRCFARFFDQIPSGHLRDRSGEHRSMVIDYSESLMHALTISRR
jgi:hypothetical protein